MRALVTRGVNAMEFGDRPDIEPGPGQVLVRPQAVGICGSDLHFLSGELTTPPAFGPQFPRVQGHEVGGVIAATGSGCPAHLRVGLPVAVHPLTGCGACRACRRGRPGACPNFRLVGVHVDGALADRVVVAAAQVVDASGLDPVEAAFCEPMSIAVRALERGGVAAGDAVAVLGAGPIGQAVTIGALDRGARVLLTDPEPARLSYARGSDSVVTDPAIAVLAREWSGGEGPDVVIDCSGAPAAIRAGVDMVAPAGCVVVVGIAHAEVGLPVNAFTQKELDVRGSSVCTAADFTAAVDIVRRHREQVRLLITHEVAFEDAPEAIAHARAHPADVMKLVIRKGDT